MIVKLELEEDDEGPFRSAEFAIDPSRKDLLNAIADTINQFLRPFVYGDYSVAAVLQELIDGRDATQIAEMMELETWEKEELIILRNAVDEHLQKRND